MRALACGPAAARLRACGARERAFGSRFASAFGRAARPQRYARLPPAPRSARMLRPSASGAALSQPAPSPPACRGSHVLRATLRVTPAHRLHALRSRAGGAGAHALVWRVGWWGRPWPRPARRPGTAAASLPTPCRTLGPSPRPATRPQRGRPARERWSTAALAPYPDVSPYHFLRYSSRVISPATTSSMSCRFSEAVSCTMESSYITDTSPSSGSPSPM